jgi:hypothetical protein
VASRLRRSNTDESRRRPATTSEDRENQIAADAYDLAEKQIRNGTASSQVITHFLKLGSTREELEKERLRYENDLTLAKIKAMESAERMEELYQEAIQAMRTYSPGSMPPEVDDEI